MAGGKAGLTVGTAGPQPPADPQLQRAADTLAAFVARVGPAFEAKVLHRGADGSNFPFLRGGEGSDYYRWCGICIVRQCCFVPSLESSSQLQ